MRVQVTPRQADITPGQPVQLSLTLTNTTEVIGGYTVRVLGADPGWVTMDVEQISLFPDEVRVVPLVVTPPKGLPAGVRRIAIQVRELTPPQESAIVDVDLNVPAQKSVQVRIDPISVTAGKRATFSVIAENTGNTIIEGRFAGDDPESKLAFGFDPGIVHLPPGEHLIVDMRVAGKRNLAGSPTVRPISLFLDDLPAEAFFTDPDATKPTARGDDAVVANATLIQKPVLSRGAFSLGGLLLAVTVFAFVITLALGKLVGQSTADRDLALQVAAARGGGTASGTSSLAGTAKLLTTGAPVSAVSVSVFDASDTSKPLVTTATNSTGGYDVGELAAGKYKISFKRAGYIPIWYPAATSDADATAVEVKTGEQKHGLDVALSGLPASISGTVTGDDVGGSTLYLETVPGRANASSSSTSANAATTTPLPTTSATAAAPAAPGAGAPAPNPLTGNSAIVQQLPIGADGTFALQNVPSPNVYQLVVVKTGYATTIQQLDVAGGEQRNGVELTLRKGDGLISGTVTSNTQPLGGVTITATSGQTTVTTVSQTDKGKLGQFTLRGLPTPGSFTLTASADGYASQTLALTLASGQKLTGVQITLGTSSGSLQGTVDELPDNAPAAGVTVTATDGLLTVQSQTQSTGQLGHWGIHGLPVPGTYTVTFTRADLKSQTVSVAIDANGTVAGGPIHVTMQPSTTSLSGTVRQGCGNLTGCTASPVGGATVTLNSGSVSYTVTTASEPTADAGRYEIANIPPGTYTLTVSTGTGTSTSSEVVTLPPGTAPPHDVTLNLSASLTGLVRVATKDSTGAPSRPWYVFLYTTAQYPSVVTAVQTTDSSGRFTFPAIDAGDYIVAVGPTNDPASSMKTVAFTVQPSQAKNLGTITVKQ
jgi:hypothetical protein